MARPKKKNTNPALSMEALLTRAVEAFIELYDDLIRGQTPLRKC